MITNQPFKILMVLIIALLTNTFACFAQITITGTVKDDQGNALSGVSVKVKDSNNGTSSDAQGAFSIDMEQEEATLVFSIISFQQQEIVLDGRTRLDVTLLPETTEIDDVVVVGYGVRRKQDVTGSIAKADLSLQKQAPNGNVMSSLRGTVPGLTVGQVTTAGSDPSITIRGRNSISGTTSPLIILDGLIYRGSISSISPSDIASMDILKDASAAAVYGSQASNGVILITTKSGSGNKDRVTIDYTGSYSLQEMTKKSMKPLSGAGFIEKIGDWYLSESRDPNDMTQMNPNWDPTLKLSAIEAENYRNGYEANWWDMLTNPSPRIQNHNISIGGQSEKTKYYLSYGYFDQKNLVKNDTYLRHTLRLNLEIKPFDWLTVGAQTGLTANNFGEVSPSFSDLIYQRPYNLPFDPQTGEQLEFFPETTIPTPLEVLRRSRNLDKNLNLIGNFFASVDIPYVKGLNYRVNFGNNYVSTNRFNYNAPNVEATAFRQYMTDYFLTLDNILTYRRDFDKHGIDLTLLYGAEINRHDGSRTTAGGIINGALGYDRLDVGDPARLTVSNDLNILPWKEQALYQMARLSYSFDKKYILTGTVRRDGFSGFSDRNKFAIFPSIAFAWRLIEEDFIKQIEQINDLKLRVSYGSTGNRTVGRYQTLAQMDVGLRNGYLYGNTGGAQLGSFLNQLPNPNLRWETTNSFNTGADFAFFDNRLSGSLDLYFSNSENLLNSRGTPTINGFSSYLINIGKIQNRGQELNVTGAPIVKKDFRWEVGINFFRNRNKILDIDGTGQDLINGADPILSYFIGQPYGVVYDYKITGIYQLGEEITQPLANQGFQTGQYKIEDVNGDGIITTADRQILGRLDPSYSLGIFNSITYKGVELKFFINSIQGGKNGYLGAPSLPLQNPDNIRNNNGFAYNYWTPENPDAQYRAIGAYVPILGDFFGPYIPRSFIRLQDLTITYSLNEKLLERLKGIRGLSVYANAQNLFTITNWDGWDPEANPDPEELIWGFRNPGGVGLDARGYPVMKNYSLGVNITF